MNRPFGRRQHASENRQQRGLAAPGRPHQQSEFAAAKRQAHALERRHLGSAAAKVLRNIRRFEYWFAHRVNTMAGSIGVTRTIAPIDDPIHMTRVSTNSPAISPGVITIGNAVPSVSRTTASPTSAAMAKPMIALSSACQRITL